jgi:hypothetical protein
MLRSDLRVLEPIVLMIPLRLQKPLVQVCTEATYQAIAAISTGVKTYPIQHIRERMRGRGQSIEAHLSG